MRMLHGNGRGSFSGIGEKLFKIELAKGQYQVLIAAGDLAEPS